jgi:hypothetical protein
LCTALWRPNALINDRSLYLWEIRSALFDALPKIIAP